MKIVFTGGGTGGHFYPIIAIAQALNEDADEFNIAESRLYYFGASPYDEEALYAQGMRFVRIPAGKLRIYPSLKTLIDLPKALVGIFVAIRQLFRIYPDVVVGKGGYDSFPTLVAARILKIPVLIHESDMTPGRVNGWAAKFAERIAVSYADAAQHFAEEKVAHTGQPIRRELRRAAREGAFEYLALQSNIPTLFVVGGSQGAQMINDVILDILPEILTKYQVIHQVGPKNIDEFKKRVDLVLKNHPNRERYRPFGFLNPLAMTMAAGAATIMITRAGSTLFEIANWGIPAIVIPFDKSNGDHSRQNAFHYARHGASIVIEERNLTPHVLESEIARLIEDSELRLKMSTAAKSFVKQDAAKIIADEIIRIALAHEKK